MPQVCTVCSHALAGRINESLCVGSKSFRGLAREYGLGEAALRRHKETHLPEALVKGQAAREEAEALDTLKQLKTVNAMTLTILREARDSRDHDLALKAIARVEKQLELQARLIGQIQDGATINIIAAPEWVNLRAVIVTALVPYPAAQTAVVRAIVEVTGEAGG